MTNYVIINYKLLLYIIFFRNKMDLYGKKIKNLNTILNCGTMNLIQLLLLDF